MITLMQRKILLALVPAVTMLLLTGCGTVRINKILTDPTRYHNKRVNVEGTVTQSYGAFVAGVYQVDDGTGKIYVLSNRSAPVKGARVKVSGPVQSGVTVMGRSFGTTIRESDRRAK